MQQEQLQELFHELSAALVLYARQWCQAPDDAVQEAFVELFRTQTPPDSPRAWLYTTTRRRAQNIARSDQRRRKHHEQADRERRQSESDEMWFQATDTSLVAVEVAEALEHLPNDQRELLVARVWGELSFDELASLMQCSVSSAHRRYRAALASLKQILTHQQDSPPPQIELRISSTTTNPNSTNPDSAHPTRTPDRADSLAKGLVDRLAKGDT
ncbi:MAG: RNA polymerase sigma factor [Planctomycetota bacterium]